MPTNSFPGPATVTLSASSSGSHSGPSATLAGQAGTAAHTGTPSGPAHGSLPLSGAPLVVETTAGLVLLATAVMTAVVSRRHLSSRHSTTRRELRATDPR
jgi:hypothetical protein